MKKRMLTGDNSTGKLHVGHYLGSLENRVKHQDAYETFIMSADTHAFAYPKYVEHPEVVHESVLSVLLDNLAVGLDPKKVTFFKESDVPQIYELGMIFSMLVSHNRALRNPTLKDEIREKNMGDTFSLGFVNFPLLQVADILCVRADVVPVGEDQLPHIEQTNEVVRKFNQTYGGNLTEVQGLVGRVKRLVGTDGNAKMSKSLNNTIYLSDTDDEIDQKVKNMYTDPTRLKATDPGHVEDNPVFIYLDAFGTDSDAAQIEDYKVRYREGRVGDVEVKQFLATILKNLIAPIREKRLEYEKQPELLKTILRDGAERVRNEADKTLQDVKEKMGLLL